MHDSAYDNIMLDLDDKLLSEIDEDKVHGIIDRFMCEYSPKRITSAAQKNRRGRPRKHFTKKVSMIETDPTGSVLIKAGRGRPGKFERRVEVTIPLGAELVSEALYVYTNGILKELK
jgi:hypothetical protein